MARDHPRGPEVEEEGLAGEVAPLLQLAVQLGELERVRLGDVLVEHEREEGPVREDGGVAGDEDAVVQRDGRKVKERREDRLDDGDDQPVVDHKLRERRRAHVAVAAVPEHQPPQVRELLQRKVGGERRLPPLAPLDADGLPTCAAWIMPTSLPPSPMAAVHAFGCVIRISCTISAFWVGAPLRGG